MRRVDGYCSRQAPGEEAPRAEVAGSERFEQISQPPVAGRRGEQDALAGVEPPPVRVVVVDDHELFADALKMFLTRDARIEVVGVASSGQEAIDSYLQTKTVWIDTVGQTANPFIIR